MDKLNPSGALRTFKALPRGGCTFILAHSLSLSLLLVVVVNKAIANFLLLSLLMLLMLTQYHRIEPTENQRNTNPLPYRKRMPKPVNAEQNGQKLARGGNGRAQDGRVPGNGAKDEYLANGGGGVEEQQIPSENGFREEDALEDERVQLSIEYSERSQE
jgi:hypothetical protein